LFDATGILYLITLIPCIFLNFVSNADLNPNEAEVAKQYPAHTAICIRDGWEFCSPELAAGMVLLETKDFADIFFLSSSRMIVLFISL